MGTARVREGACWSRPMDRQDQVRYCACGTRLARDNRGVLCSACQNRARNTLLAVPSVPPAFWLTDRMRDAFANRHMGQIIYAYRTHPFHGKVVPQEVVARWAGISQTQLSRVESGSPLLDLKRLMHWAHTLRIPPRLLWFHLDEPAPRGEVSADARPRGGQTEEVSTSLRRHFVALGGFAVTSHVLGMLESELDLMHMTLDRGTTSEERTSNIEGIAGDLGVQVVKTPPEAILDPALKTLHSIRALLEERQPTRHQVRLVRASARLSIVIGEIMFTLNRFGLAHEWYRTAEHAAHDVGDGDLADTVLANQANLPTYSDDPRGVLALLSPRLERDTPPSPAVAWLWGFKARAHAALNEPDEFWRSMHQAHESLARSPGERITGGILSCPPERLAFYEATGAARLNDAGRAVSAADRALSLYDPCETTEPALVKLERASALAGAGDGGSCTQRSTAGMGLLLRGVKGTFDGRCAPDIARVCQGWQANAGSQCFRHG